jgi:SAM-dependent methyltransferase
MVTTNNYDIIARRYDFLSRLIFRQAQVRAQAELLCRLGDGTKVLIVGGGTGWILEALAAVRPSGLEITYVEISGNMLELARKRDYRQNDVVFVHAPIEQWVPAPRAAKGGQAEHAVTGEGAEGMATGERFDSILTGFLFDNFSPGRAGRVFHLLDSMLEKGGAWLFTDFFYQKGRGRLWQGLLLKAMYLFFGLVSKVEAKELTDMVPFFTGAGYREVYAAFHYGGFIKAIAYQKAR